MKRVKNISDLKVIAADWNPSLTKVNSTSMAADYINFPHEDYPDMVPSTNRAMDILEEWLLEGDIQERDIRQIHQICMEGKAYLRLGEYRMGEVIVGEQLIPPQPYLINPMLMSICPIGLDSFNTIEELIDWYKEFETIHPFEDGNGRVGGVILATISKMKFGYHLVAAREYHYTVNPILNRITNTEDELLNNPKYFDMNDSFEERAIFYVSEKMKNFKFNQILAETERTQDLLHHIMRKDLNSIIVVLNELIT